MTAIWDELRIHITTPAGTANSTVALFYTPLKPYEIRAVFNNPDRFVEWVFDRELLVSGFITAVGAGDIRVQPTANGRRIRITLTSDTGRAAIDLDSADLAAFLARTFDLVALGDEPAHLDLDQVTARLLNDGGVA